MTSLAAVILALVTVYTSPQATVYARHLRRHELGPEARAEQLAQHFERAAQVVGVDVALLVALGYLESSFDAAAIAPTSGAEGLLQLHPRSRWARAWRRDCRAQGASCEARSVYWGARALRDGLQTCGEERAGIGWYRAGRCLAGPRGAAGDQAAGPHPGKGGGQMTSRWTILRQLEPTQRRPGSPHRRARVLARCFCGRECVVWVDDMHQGRSCGCRSRVCMAHFDASCAVERALAQWAHDGGAHPFEALADPIGEHREEVASALGEVLHTWFQQGACESRTAVEE